MQPYRKKLRQYWLVNLMFQYLYACLATRVTTHQSKKQPNYFQICPKSSHNSVLSALFQASPKSCQTLDLLLESNLSLSIFDDESSHTACCHQLLATTYILSIVYCRRLQTQKLEKTMVDCLPPREGSISRRTARLFGSQ